MSLRIFRRGLWGIQPFGNSCCHSVNRASPKLHTGRLGCLKRINRHITIWVQPANSILLSQLGHHRIRLIQTSIQSPLELGTRQRLVDLLARLDRGTQAAANDRAFKDVSAQLLDVGTFLGARRAAKVCSAFLDAFRGRLQRSLLGDTGASRSAINSLAERLRCEPLQRSLNNGSASG